MHIKYSSVRCINSPTVYVLMSLFEWKNSRKVLELGRRCGMVVEKVAIPDDSITACQCYTLEFKMASVLTQTCSYHDTMSSGMGGKAHAAPWYCKSYALSPVCELQA